MRHVFLELLELHPRLLDSLLRLLDSLLRLLDSQLRLLDRGLDATLLDCVDDQEGEDEDEAEREEHVCQSQLKCSKLHR